MVTTKNKGSNALMLATGAEYVGVVMTATVVLIGLMNAAPMIMSNIVNISAVSIFMS